MLTTPSFQNPETNNSGNISAKLADYDIALPRGLRYKAAMTTKRTNPDFLNGVPELLILSLVAHRPMYGYELVQTIRKLTGGTLEFGEGCIYPILHHLEADGSLGGKRQIVGGRSRVVYRITAKGSKHLAGSTAKWQIIVEAVQRALHGGSHDEPALA